MYLYIWHVTLKSKLKLSFNNSSCELVFNQQTNPWPTFKVLQCTLNVEFVNPFAKDGTYWRLHYINILQNIQKKFNMKNKKNKSRNEF